MPNHSFRLFVPLLGIILTAACPPFDKPGSSGDDAGGVTDDGAAGEGAAGTGTFAGTSGADARNGTNAPGGTGGSIVATSPTNGDGAASGSASNGSGGVDDWTGFPDGDPFGDDPTGGGGDSTGADGTGNPTSDPNTDPADGGSSGSPGYGGAIGTGRFSGSSAPDATAPDNTPPAARLAAWGGRWDGQVTYHVPMATSSILTGPHVDWVPETMPIALRVDDLSYDPSIGYGSITARVAVANCLLSADLQGTIFFGDDLSPVANPILSFQAAGSNASGQFLSLRLNGSRMGNALTGTLNLQGVDQLKAPCAEKDMRFELDRPAAN